MHKEGLGQEVFHAHFNGLLGDIAPVVSSKEEDGEFGVILPDQAGGFQAVQVRHFPVQQHQIIRLTGFPGGAHHCNGLVAAGGGMDRYAGIGHALYDIAADVLVVVGHDHLCYAMFFPE